MNQIRVVDRARCRALLFATGLAVSALASGSAWASTPVAVCGQELNVAGDYHLAADLGPCPGFGVVITASNVRFTLAGHTLSGVSGAGSCDIENPQTGIAVQSPATSVTVSGGTVTGFWDGITLAPASRVTGMRVVGNCFNGVIVSGNGQVDTTVVTGSGNDGIALCPGQDALVTANEVSGSSRYGISLSCGDVGTADRNEIVRNILHANGAPGADGGGIAIFAGNDHRIIGNSASENLIGVFLFTTTGSTVRDNTANGNRDAGIVLRGDAQGSVIRGNTAFHNARVDLQDDSPSCGTNEWRRNFFVTDIVAGAPNGGPTVPCLR